MDMKEIESQIREVYTTLMYAFQKLNKRIKRIEAGGAGGGASYDIIWTNAYPDALFPVTDLIIPELAVYDLILIVYKTRTDLTNILSVMAPNGGAPDLSSFKITGNGVELRVRDCQITIADNKIHFGNCKVGTTSSSNNNAYNVPVAIYGIKQ